MQVSCLPLILSITEPLVFPSKTAPSTAFLTSINSNSVLPTAHTENSGVTLDSSLLPPTSNTSSTLFLLPLKSMRYIKTYLKHAHFSLLRCHHHHTPKMNESPSPGLPVPSLLLSTQMSEWAGKSGPSPLCQNPPMTLHPSEEKAEASAVTLEAWGSSPHLLPSGHTVLFPEHGRHSPTSEPRRPRPQLGSFFPLYPHTTTSISSGFSSKVTFWVRPPEQFYLMVTALSILFPWFFSMEVISPLQYW